MQLKEIERIVGMQLGEPVRIETSFTRRLSYIFFLHSQKNKYVLKIQKWRDTASIEDALSDTYLQQQAQKEWNALQTLYTICQDKACPVNSIKPVAFIKSLHGILTETVEGEDFFPLLRERGARVGNAELRDALFTIGKGIAYLHEQTENGTTHVAPLLWPIQKPALDTQIAERKKQSKKMSAPATIELPGFSLRDIRISSSGELYLMDPEGTGTEPDQKVLGECLASIHLAYQGSFSFYTKRVRKEYSEAFLQGYRSLRPTDKQLLDIFLLSSLTVHYNHAQASTAERALGNLPFSNFLLRTFYLNHRYLKTIKTLLKSTSRMQKPEYETETKEHYQVHATAESYKQSYAGSWSWKNIRSKVISRREQKIVKGFLSAFSKENLRSVLDVPVGTGKMTKILLDAGFRVSAGDISKAMMDQIDPQLKSHKQLRRLAVMDASALPFPENAFDLVLCIRLLHRVDRDTFVRILKETSRTSRRYCIISFGLDTPWQRTRIRLKKLLGGSDTSRGRISRNEIKNHLDAVGLRPLKCKRVLPIFSNEIIYLLEC